MYIYIYTYTHVYLYIYIIQLLNTYVPTWSPSSLLLDGAPAVDPHLGGGPRVSSQRRDVRMHTAHAWHMGRSRAQWEESWVEAPWRWWLVGIISDGFLNSVVSTNFGILGYVLWVKHGKTMSSTSRDHDSWALTKRWCITPWSWHHPISGAKKCPRVPGSQGPTLLKNASSNKISGTLW